MKATDVHNLDDPQLVEFIDRSRQELFNLRFQHATGQLENTAGVKGAKKDLARGLGRRGQAGPRHVRARRRARAARP